MEAGEGVWLESKLVTTGQEVWAADVLLDPVYSFTMWSIYRTAQPLTCYPHPSNITWLSSVSLTGGALCLSTHTPPLTAHTHITFSRISDLYFLGTRTRCAPPYLLVSKLRSPDLNLSRAQVFFLKGRVKAMLKGREWHQWFSLQQTSYRSTIAFGNISEKSPRERIMSHI